MTGYEISHHFNEKLGIMISPNTIYTKLSTMERKAWITCASNKHGRAYDLTDKGQKVIEDINNITEEIRNHTKTLLN
jgi:DNA-binding PadR family transcriptional regulator